MDVHQQGHGDLTSITGWWCNNHVEKMKVNGKDDNPYIMENKNVWNHQPNNYWLKIAVKKLGVAERSVSVVEKHSFSIDSPNDGFTMSKVKIQFLICSANLGY